jgi:hypothetical protein
MLQWLVGLHSLRLDAEHVDFEERLELPNDGQNEVHVNDEEDAENNREGNRLGNKRLSAYDGR